MNTKLKTLGWAVFAMLAVGAFAAMNATAETGGHFTSNSGTEKTILTGTENEPESHTTELGIPGLTPITCTDSTYFGTINGNTANEVTIEPHYTECGTTDGDWDEVDVHMNNCDYVFKIGDSATDDNTVDLDCPEGNEVEITHGSSCTINIPPFTGNEGVSYTADEIEGAETITLDATAEGFDANFEAGFCVLLGTGHTGQLTGSVTVEGFEDEGGDEGPRVDITAIGG